MAKDKKTKPAKDAKVTLTLRLDAADRKAFGKACDAMDTKSSRELRKFIRGFIAGQTEVVAPPVLVIAEAAPVEAKPATPRRTAKA